MSEISALETAPAGAPETLLPQQSGSGANAGGIDVAGNSTTTATIAVGGSYVDFFETVGDRDWIAVNLIAGHSYTVSVTGAGITPSTDPFVNIFQPGSANPTSGVVLAFDDDSGPGYNSLVTFMATQSGAYFIEAWDKYNHAANSPGYEVLISDNGLLPTLTNSQIADQLVNGYFNHYSQSWRAFNLGIDRTITYHLNANVGSTYANDIQLALDIWSQLTGIEFYQTGGNSQINFDGAGTGTDHSTSSTVSGNSITQSIVYAAPGLFTGANTNLGLQAVLAEVGHALGLGYTSYNVYGWYGATNLFTNDSWQASITSYFDQVANTLVDASYATLLTPTIADILAIQTLYGDPTTTHTGSSVYGYASNVGSLYDFDFYNAPFAFTISDDSGIDLLDLSLSTHNNRVNLTPGTYSDILGLIGNMGIDVHTMIENVTTGSGADDITGNDGANILNGGAGNDRINGGLGSDRIYFDSADNPAFVTGGGGTDTLLVFGTYLPTSYNLSAMSFEFVEQQLTDTTGQWWASIIMTYNQSWQRLTTHGLADDSRTWNTEYDVAGGLWYSSAESWYTAGLGRLMNTNYIKDNGLLVAQSFDYTQTQWWDYYTNYYDAQNRVTNTDGIANDGRYWSSTNDLNGSQQWWSNYTIWYDRQDPATRHVINEEGVADDGRHWTTTYDVLDLYSWNTETNWFDALGTMLYTTHT